jgi:hypothetical protein
VTTSATSRSRRRAWDKVILETWRADLGVNPNLSPGACGSTARLGALDYIKPAPGTVIFGPDSTHETVDLDLAAGRELLARLGLR